MLKSIYHKIDKFVLGIILAVLLAYWFPEWGATHSPIPLGKITSWGIALIFFFYGLKLKFSEIKSGLANWRLHLLIQLSTFVLFPVIILAFKPMIATGAQHDLWLSFFFLAALPSTVSSSVVMTAMAKGNLPAAIFNASISGIIGILLTPLWMGAVMGSQGGFEFWEVYRQLLFEIVLPLSLGLLLQRFFRTIVSKYGNQLTRFDQSVILLIVYKSFSASFEENLFQHISWNYLLMVLVGSVFLFFLVFGIMNWLSRVLGFSHADTTTALFCGSKKSLTHGTVFSQAIFGTGGNLGLMLLPLMLFHAFQIIVVSMIATRRAQGPANGGTETVDEAEQG